MSRSWLLVLFVGLAGCVDSHWIREDQPTTASQAPQFGGNQFARDHTAVPTGPNAQMNP